MSGWWLSEALFLDCMGNIRFCIRKENVEGKTGLVEGGGLDLFCDGQKLQPLHQRRTV